MIDRLHNNPDIIPIKIDSEESLKNLLDQNNIDYSDWGKETNDGKKASKTIEDLWIEIQNGETEMIYLEGVLTRRVSVANMNITTTNPKTNEIYELYEAERYTFNGQKRKERTLPCSIAGKLTLSTETPQEGALRELEEETSQKITENKVTYISDEAEPQEKIEDSKSYPNLQAWYITYTFNIEIGFSNYEDNVDGYIGLEDEYDKNGERLGQKKTVTKWRRRDN